MSKISLEEVQALALKALECIESGDPAETTEFSKTSGFSPAVFTNRLEIEGESALALEVARWRRTGFDPMLDITGRKPASWVLREVATGAVIMETHDEAVVSALNTAKYYAVPIHDYLAQFNGSVHDEMDWVKGGTPQAQPQKAQKQSNDDSPIPGM